MNIGLVKVLESASAKQTYTCKFFLSELSKSILYRNTFFLFSFKNEFMENPLRIVALSLRVTPIEAEPFGRGLGAGGFFWFLTVPHQACPVTIVSQRCSSP